MADRPSYHWNLRLLMAERGMFATTDLIGPLAERGITLSSVQVYRLVTGTPERLNLTVLAALCDILGVGPSELITVTEAVSEQRAVGKEQRVEGGRRAPERRPTRARIVRDEP